MSEPQDVSGLMDQIHELKTQLADAEKRGAVKALRLLSFAGPGETPMSLADRIDSGEVTP